MKGIIFVALSCMIVLAFPVYAVNRSDSAYTNGITFYHVLIPSGPVLVGETEFPPAYFGIVSWPIGRGESVLDQIAWNVEINKTKVDEIMNFLLEDERGINEFRFKDQPDYRYVINPSGILVVYSIPEGKKLSTLDFQKEKIRFLNETTERLRDVGIRDELKLIDDYGHDYSNYGEFKSGFSYTHIKELTNEDNETYRQLFMGGDYEIIRDRDITILIPKTENNYERILDVISIGRDKPDILMGYRFLAYSGYNKDEIDRIEKEMESVSPKLNNIMGTLNGDLNSTKAFSILEDISMSKNGTTKQELALLLSDIKSVDAFVKSSKEIKNRQSTEWVDVLFGFEIDENMNYTKQVNILNDKYDILERERKDLFDITVAIYSASLQKEGISKQLQSVEQNTREQIRTSWKIAIITIILSIVFSLLIQWRFQNKKMSELTEKQIDSNKEVIEQFTSKVEELNSNEVRIIDLNKKSNELLEKQIQLYKEGTERPVNEVGEARSERDVDNEGNTGKKFPHDSKDK